MKNHHLSSALALILLLVSLQARAVDSVAVAYGSDDDDDEIDFVRISLQWNWDKKWMTDGDWYVGGYWDAEFGFWDSDPGTTGNDSLFEISLTPVLRLQPHRSSKNAGTPYLEGGMGVHLLSESTIRNKDMSTSLQFGSHLGFGFVFGDNQAFDIGYRFQHLSNAGIEKPNPGINFHIIRLGYRF